MSTSKFPRVTRRRFLKDTGLTLAVAGAAPVLSAPFVSKALAADGYELERRIRELDRPPRHLSSR